MRQSVRIAFVIVCLCVSWNVSFGAAKQYPFMGDWQGRWNPSDGVYPPRLAAQVIPWKGGSYQIRLFTELRKEAPEYVVIEAKSAGSVLEFKHGSWSGKIEGDRFTGVGTLRDKRGGFEMNRVFYESPRLGAHPPKEALVLFNGSSLDEWEMIERDGKTGPVTWKKSKGIMSIVPQLGNHRIGDSISTKRTFRDFHLHIEFRNIWIVEK